LDTKPSAGAGFGCAKQKNGIGKMMTKLGRNPEKTQALAGDRGDKQKQNNGFGIPFGDAKPIHLLYVGSPDGKEFSTSDRQELRALVGARFPSFTMSEADGHYQGEALPTLLVHIASSDTASILQVAQQLGRRFNQMKIGLQVGGLYHSLPVDFDEVSASSHPEGE
jgi:hypothetical protein